MTVRAQQAKTADEDAGVVTALLLMLLASQPESPATPAGAWSDYAHRLRQTSAQDAWWISGLPQ